MSACKMNVEQRSAALASFRALAKDLDTEIRSCRVSGGAFFWAGPVGLWLHGCAPRPEGGKMNATAAAMAIRGILRPLRGSANPTVPLASVRELLGRDRKHRELRAYFLRVGGTYYDVGLLHRLLDSPLDGKVRIVVHDVGRGICGLILGTKEWVVAIAPFCASENQKAGAKRIEDLGIEVAGAAP